MRQTRINTIDDYEPLVGAEFIDRIRQKARSLNDRHVAHISSTYYYGGGVAQLLSSLTLLMNSVGIKTGWRVIQGASTFSASQKKCTTRFKEARSI